MGLQEWIAGIARAIDKEYDRRIRRASNVVSYGTHSHAATDDHENAADEEAAVIVNIPRGTPVQRIGDDPPTAHDDPEV